MNNSIQELRPGSCFGSSQNAVNSPNAYVAATYVYLIASIAIRAFEHSEPQSPIQLAICQLGMHFPP
jgi:hypothetical protein